LPKEFIEKANAVELPRLNPDDFVDTDPPAQAEVALSARSQANPEATKAESPTRVPSATQETVVIPKRRKSAPIPKEVLSGATPIESKPLLRNKVFWILGGMLVFLILLWSHLKGGRVEQSISSASAALPPIVSQRVGSDELPSQAASTVNNAPAVASTVNPIPPKPQPNPIAEGTQGHKIRPEALPAASSGPSRRQKPETPQPALTPATSAIPSNTSATTRPPKVFWQQQPE
jgi:hypothetical protein